MPNPKRYDAIALALEWTEYEVKDDGLFLQPEEADTINAALLAGTAAAAGLVTANTEITGLKTKVTDLESKLGAAETQTTALNDKITQLEATVAQYAGQSSGNGTTIVTKKDPEQATVTEVKSSILDPESELNRFAKRKVEAAKKNKKSAATK